MSEFDNNELVDISGFDEPAFLCDIEILRPSKQDLKNSEISRKRKKEYLEKNEKQKSGRSYKKD